jgi:hypothetical protein
VQIVAEHELKTQPPYFAALLDGTKTFELRFDDRNFQVGDTLHLREYDPEHGYTGRGLLKTISYVMRGGTFALSTGYCILALKDYQPLEASPETIKYKLIDLASREQFKLEFLSAEEADRRNQEYEDIGSMLSWEPVA